METNVIERSSDLDQLKSAVDKLYAAAVSPLRQLSTEEPSAKGRQVAIAKYVKWANNVAVCYGKVAQPSLDYDNDPEALGTGVLGCFYDASLFHRTLSGLLATIPPNDDGPRATTGGLGVLPPELVRPERNIGLSSGLFGLPESGAHDRAHLVNGELVKSASAETWDELRVRLTEIWHNYRIYSLRLIAWVNARLQECEDSILPRATTCPPKPESLGGCGVVVRLAGCTFEKYLPPEVAMFFIDLAKSDWAMATANIKRDLVEALPEFAPFIEDCKVRRERKGHNQSDKIKYRIVNPIVRGRIALEYEVSPTRQSKRKVANGLEAAI